MRLTAMRLTAMRMHALMSVPNCRLLYIRRLRSACPQGFVCTARIWSLEAIMPLTRERTLLLKR